VAGGFLSAGLHILWILLLIGLVLWLLGFFHARLERRAVVPLVGTVIRGSAGAFSHGRACSFV